MRFVLSVTLLFVMLCGCYAQSAGKNEIPFTLLPSGHILLKASFDGVEGNFIFDTGGGLTAFTKTYFQKLKQVVKQDGGYTGFRATGERLDLDLYQVKHASFGPVKKAVEEVSFLDMDLGGLDGILSLMLVDKYPFTIDLEKKVLRFETAASLAAIRKKAKAIPVQLEQSREKALSLFAYFTVNDSLQLQFSLDSGAGKDVFRINAKYLQALGVNTGDTARVKKMEKKSEVNNSSFTSSIYVTRLPKLAATAAPAIITTNFPVQLVEGLIYDGIIWINWLGPSITIDLPGKTLLVQR